MDENDQSFYVQLLSRNYRIAKTKVMFVSVSSHLAYQDTENTNPKTDLSTALPSVNADHKEIKGESPETWVGNFLFFLPFQLNCINKYVKNLSKILCAVANQDQQDCNDKVPS